MTEFTRRGYEGDEDKALKKAFRFLESQRTSMPLTSRILQTFRITNHSIVRSCYNYHTPHFTCEWLIVPYTYKKRALDVKMVECECVFSVA
jgi:hypothetical protein